MPQIIPAKARSGFQIDTIAECVLRRFQPDAVTVPTKVEVEPIFEFGLPELGIESCYRELFDHG